MSMKYFTLSAVCMLIFCMLLALSGTTDFPGGHSGSVSHSRFASPPPAPNPTDKGQALASVYSLPEDSAPQAETEDRATAAAGSARQNAEDSMITSRQPPHGGTPSKYRIHK